MADNVWYSPLSQYKPEKNRLDEIMKTKEHKKDVAKEASAGTSLCSKKKQRTALSGKRPKKRV